VIITAMIINDTILPRNKKKLNGFPANSDNEIALS